MIDQAVALISAKLAERKTVHAWLNQLGVPSKEMGRNLCLLRRLRITCDEFDRMRRMDGRDESMILLDFIKQGRDLLRDLAEAADSAVINGEPFPDEMNHRIGKYLVADPYERTCTPPVQVGIAAAPAKGDGRA